MFVVKLTYKKPIEIIDSLRPDHLDFLDKYYKKGIFIASGRQNPLKGGVILATKTTKSDLETILKEDPFYTKEAAEFEITEFTPNKFHPQLKDLVS